MTRLLGPIVQNAYVVHDLEIASSHWASKLGVGPFYAMEHVAFGPSYFRDQPLAFDMSVAIAQWGEIQIELIVQHDSNPSIYTEFASSQGQGMHHVGVMTDSVEEHVARLRPHGIEPVQWGITAGGMRFAYLDTDLHPGCMVELIERGPAVDAFFSLVRRGAERWDGTRPLRLLT